MKKLLLAVLFFPFLSIGQIITTIAGNGTPVHGGDGGPATAAGIEGPAFPAFDINGNLYFAENLHNTISRISTTGIITTYAGNTVAGYSGDGGPATAAQLNNPVAIAVYVNRVAAKSYIYISDEGGQRIRKVDVITGIISTFAGTGVAGYSGDGGPATNAKMFQPFGIACDTVGNVYFADYYNYRIRKIDTFGIISLFAGNGVAGYAGDGGPATAASIYPVGIAVDKHNNVYFGGPENVIRKINSVTGIISTIAGVGTAGFSGDGGPATAAQLNHPESVVVDREGNVYLSDNDNHRVRKIDTVGTITTAAGNGVPFFAGDNGPATAAELYIPEGIALDGCGNLYIADDEEMRIRKVTFNPEGIPSVSISAAPGDTVCIGTPVIYTASVTASSTFEYQWFVNGILTSSTSSTYTYTPVSGDSISCVFVGTSTCSNQTSICSSNIIYMLIDTFVNSSISLNAFPTASVGAIVTINAVVANAGSSYNIKWFNRGVLFNTTSISSVNYIKAAGTDSITATIVPLSSCYDSSMSAIVTVAASTTGINMVVTQPSIFLYPNPATTSLTITSADKITHITITNLLGQTVYSSQFAVGSLPAGQAGLLASIDVASFPAGMYFVRVNDNVVRKFAKE